MFQKPCVASIELIGTIILNKWLNKLNTKGENKAQCEIIPQIPKLCIKS